MTELDALLILNACPGMTNLALSKLITYYGTAKEVLKAGKGELLERRIIKEKAASKLFDFPQDKFLKKEYNLITKAHVEILTQKCDSYPDMLREICDAPQVLYVKGTIPSDHPFMVSIVGSRRASYYGTTVAAKFASDFAQMGFVVVSGLARGIDTAAHKGALKAGGLTCAVLGSGLARIYPYENAGLFQEISRNGAVISEFSMEAEPLPFRFPRRNRIVSGLSCGVVVVEAAARSGALITADCALEQGREVFAVPGKVDAPTSRGVHNLIKQGAKLACCVEDVTEEFSARIEDFLSSRKKEQADQTRSLKDDNCCDDAEDSKGAAQHIPLTEVEQKVFSLFGEKPLHIDECMMQCALPFHVLNAALLQCEMKGAVEQFPGKIFQKKNLKN
ncbi:DNA-processing protein DprA [Candidatus Omnitrophota bacterium]